METPQGLQFAELVEVVTSLSSEQHVAIVGIIAILLGVSWQSKVIVNQVRRHEKLELDAEPLIIIIAGMSLLLVAMASNNLKILDDYSELLTFLQDFCTPKSRPDVAPMMPRV